MHVRISVQYFGWSMMPWIEMLHSKDHEHNRRLKQEMQSTHKEMLYVQRYEHNCKLHALRNTNAKHAQGDAVFSEVRAQLQAACVKEKKCMES
eukprot:1156477-Pelagomonas_calceolata.AAC.8